MAEITEKELKKQIANGMFSPVYLLYGEEDVYKRQVLRLCAFGRYFFLHLNGTQPDGHHAGGCGQRHSSCRSRSYPSYDPVPAPV